MPAPSAVNLTHQRVQRADDRDQVGDVRALHGRRRRREGGERGGAEFHPPRPGPSVGDDVAAELAPRRLDGDVDLALGNAIALRDDLEMVDYGLHRGVQLLARRQHDLAVVRDPGLAFQALEAIEALLDDLDRRPHLLDPDAVAVVRVSVRQYGHAKVDPVVEEVRVIAAEIPVDPGGPQHRPRLPERDRIRAIQQSESASAVLPDLVLFEQAVVVVDRLWHPLDELAALGIEARRDVLREPAGLEVPRVHAVAGDELREIEDYLAFAERVPEHRDRSELERPGSEPDEVRVDPVQLR